MIKTRAIAFYLPQFYPTPENDKWWSPGFTEWTNVARSKPLFPGHYQPRIPRDLGFYDLRVPETREKQAQLAREAGIEGFCYWHYWFNGKRLLSEVFKEVVETGKPDFPFCLCWANHSWYAKTWDPNKPNKLLIEQTYKGVEDYTAHFYEMLSAFKDERYMKVDGKLIFGIYDTDMFPDTKLFIDVWNNLATKNGLNGFYFFGFAQGQKRYRKTMTKGFDTVVYDCLVDIALKYIDTKPSLISRVLMKLRKNGYLHYTDYEDYVKRAINIFSNNKDCTPCINPDFDHSPRSSDKGIILHKSTPARWRRLLEATIDIVRNKENSNNLLFIKSWNEWGEGNYLEPDLRYGKQYIEESAKALNKGNTDFNNT